MDTSENWIEALPVGGARTPAIMQMEASECGAASLAIILAYYGRHIPLAQLRRECGVSRDGSKASNILAAAKSHGLEAQGFRKPLACLKDVQYPYILFWNFNHFLVVEGYRRGRIYLNDPDSGRRKVSAEEFAAAYSGIVLTMKPGAEFQRAGGKSSVTSGIRERLRGSAPALAMCVCASLFQVVPGVVYPALLQLFIDRVLVQAFRDWAGPIILGILLTAILRSGLTQIQSGMLRRFETRLSTTLSSQFVWHLLHLPSSYYSQRFSGELSGRIQLNDSVSDVLAGRLATAAIDALVMIFYLTVMFQFDRLLTGLSVMCACGQFLLLWRIGKERQDGNKQLAHLSGKTCGVGLSGLQAIRTIKASALEAEFFEKWSGHFAKLMNARQKIDQLNQTFSVLPAFASGLMTMLVLAAGGFRVMDGHLSIGQLVAFQTLMGSFLRPLNSLVSLGSVVQMLKTDLARLDDVLENPPVPQPLSLAKNPHCWSGRYRLKGRVELRNVSFGYHPLAAPLIRDLSLTIEPGQRVALVGASGSGKSTVARLAAGLYEPAAGEILFDGRPRASIPREVLTNSLALVEQEIPMFEGTLLENLTLWDGTIPTDEVAAACQDALIYDVISAMPRGHDSELLEGGSNLSGGERQRLELARALASNPSILILDEATSALDADIEHRIHRNLRRRGCACLIAAHRLSTILDCHEIIVLDRGRVVERGRHEELIRGQGEYARLLASEAGVEVG